MFLNPGAGKRRTGIASSPWASQEGQDFLANHVVPSIDLVTTHIWADNWMGCAPGARIDAGLVSHTLCGWGLGALLACAHMGICVRRG